MSSIAPLSQESAAQVLRDPTAAESAFSLAVRQAKALTSSTLVPEAYRGDKNLGNAMIALEVANRIGASPIMVMQNLYVVHGRPSWSSTFLIATVNACGRFTPLRFEVVGLDPDAEDYRVRAVAKDKESGETCEGPWITWKMVKAEGWAGKTGSKWKTMPSLMFNYRAAAFWSRLYAPELSLGIHTAEEVQDFADRPQPVQRADVLDLQTKLEQRGAIEHQPAPPADMDPATGEIPAPDQHEPMTTKQIKAALHLADTREQVIALGEAIASIPDDDERVQCEVLYDERLVALA